MKKKNKKEDHVGIGHTTRSETSALSQLHTTLIQAERTMKVREGTDTADGHEDVKGRDGASGFIEASQRHSFVNKAATSDSFPNKTGDELLSAGKVENKETHGCS